MLFVTSRAICPNREWIRSGKPMYGRCAFVICILISQRMIIKTFYQFISESNRQRRPNFIKLSSCISNKIEIKRPCSYDMCYQLRYKCISGRKLNSPEHGGQFVTKNELMLYVFFFFFLNVQWNNMKSIIIYYNIDTERCK